MQLTKGTTLKAKGGWDAEVILISQLNDGFYAAHQPGTEEESPPIWHWANGTAHSQFSVGAPPVYHVGHPCDLEMGEYEL